MLIAQTVEKLRNIKDRVLFRYCQQHLRVLKAYGKDSVTQQKKQKTAKSFRFNTTKKQHHNPRPYGATVCS